MQKLQEKLKDKIGCKEIINIMEEIALLMHIKGYKLSNFNILEMNFKLSYV